MDNIIFESEPKHESLDVLESLEGVVELSQRYDYDGTVWICNYTVNF